MKVLVGVHNAPWWLLESFSSAFNLLGVGSFGAGVLDGFLNRRQMIGEQGK